MSPLSSQDNDDEENNREEVQGPAVGSKRTASQRSTCPPPTETKRRKQIAKRSPMWEFFTQKESDPSTAICNYCGTEIGCDSKTTGTSPMINHNERCKLYKAHKESKTQKVMTSDGNGGVVTALKFDKEVFRRSVNEMIVLNELPFSFVESEGFRRFCANVIPMYKVHCRKTATKDIFGMYMLQKLALKNLFGCAKKRVSLTTDIWTAPTTSFSYMVITAHWIDANWDLQKRIISFKPVTDHKGKTIGAHLINCLEEWGIEKVFTVTCDNAKANDKGLRLFTQALRLKGANGLVKDGSLLHMRCCAHVLNLIVREGLADLNESVAAIRNAVKYVRSSYDRLKSFARFSETGKVSRGSLSMDCKTRWNYTYLMLSAALKLRGPFEKMLKVDRLFFAYFLQKEDDGLKRVGPPTNSDWDEVARLVKFLKIFFNCTLAFSASQKVTSSLCYNEIVIIERNLIALSSNADEKLRNEAMSMRGKFEKYWDGLLNMNPLVIIASMFDPRNKLEFATICFDKLYGKGSMESEHLKTSILKVMHELYDEYVLVLKPSNSQCDSSGSRGSSIISEGAGLMFDFSDEDGYNRDDIYSEMDSGNANDMFSSELDMYLLEPRVPRNKNGLGLEYDVLSWWRRNSVRFPVLSELVKDVLAVQVSSVASESAFSTSGRLLDPYRSCLTPFMVESLVCTQQWLRNSLKAEHKIQNLDQMFEELDFQDSLDTRDQVETDH